MPIYRTTADDGLAKLFCDLEPLVYRPTLGYTERGEGVEL